MTTRSKYPSKDSQVQLHYAISQSTEGVRGKQSGHLAPISVVFSTRGRRILTSESRAFLFPSSRPQSQQLTTRPKINKITYVFCVTGGFPPKAARETGADTVWGSLTRT